MGIDWAWLAADGAMTKAPLGGPETGPNPTDRAKKVRIPLTLDTDSAHKPITCSG